MQPIRDLAEDLKYQLAVLEKIRKSEAAILAKGTVSTAMVKQRLRRWLKR